MSRFAWEVVGDVLWTAFMLALGLCLGAALAGGF